MHHYKRKINPKITPICSRCTYFDDCKNTLGINYDSPETSNPSLFDIKLVPYVQEATVEQLKIMV